MTSGGQKGKSGGVGVVTVDGKERKAAKSQALGPYKFSHAQFEKVSFLLITFRGGLIWLETNRMELLWIPTYPKIGKRFLCSCFA